MKHDVQRKAFTQPERQPVHACRSILRFTCVTLMFVCVAFCASEAGAVPGELTFVEAQFDGVGGVDGLWSTRAVAVSPDGQHVYVTGSDDDAVAAFSRNPTTGELTFVEAEFDGVGGVDGLWGAWGVAVSPDGQHVYVTGASDNAVAAFSRNSSTGELAFVEAQFDGVAGVDGLAEAFYVAVSLDGQHVYVTGYFDHSVAVFSRDGTTGELTFIEAEFDGVGGVDGLLSATSVAVSPDGQHVYVAGCNDSAVAVFSREPALVPAASLMGLALLSLALLGLGVRHRRIC